MSIAVTSKAKWTASKFGWLLRKLWYALTLGYRGIRFGITLPFIIFSLTLTILKYGIIFFLLLLVITVGVGMI